MNVIKPWIRSKIPPIYLILLLIVVLGGFILLNKKAELVRYPAYDLQVEAAQLMADSLKIIHDYRLSLGININQQLDPNLTGIIGEEFNGLTTTLGNLEAKRTSTNPSFAALMVRYFTEIGLHKGDTVAVAASGSFPALILAVLSAARVMELDLSLIYSMGSSMYGANIEGLTFDNLLKVLNNRGLLPFHLSAVSPGGGGDQGEGIPLFAEQSNVLLDVARKTGIRLIYENTLSESIEKRLEIFSEKKVRCFVNIGGASANYGNTSASLSFPDGLVSNYYSIPDNPERGLIFEFASRGLPVINLLNIRGLALKNGLIVDPVPLPVPGRESVYYQIKYKKFYVLSFLILFILILFFLKYLSNIYHYRS